MISSTKCKETECDPLFSIAVYKFFEQRNMRLRGSPDFAPGMNNFDTQLISAFFMLLNPVRLETSTCPDLSLRLHFIVSWSRGTL